MEGKVVLLFILFQVMIFTAVFAVEEDSTSRSAHFVLRENKQLIGYVVKRFESPGLLSCGQQCLRNAWCTSTNYKVSSKKDNKGTCELNKHEIFLINENTKFHEEEGVTFSMRLEGCLMTGCLNGGSCLLDDRKQTFSSCSCKPPWNGDRCHVKLDTGCSSTPCLNGGTCTDMINGFRCACAASFTGMHCELNTEPECSWYSVDAEADRSVSFPRGVNKCDRNTLTPGWHRFNSTAGSKIPTSCVPIRMCNTDATGWLNGAHPTLQDGVVTRNVCFHWNGNCCNWVVKINVRNCGLFFVYQLVKTPSCHLRYCVIN